MDCATRWYGLHYDPPPPKSLDDLGSKARVSLNTYLVQRLGADYVSQLVLTGGQVVDRGELLKKVPESVNFQWHPPKYDLHFRVPTNPDSDPFCASVELDDDGTVLKPIGLPQLRKYPERGKIIPVNEAILVAKAKGIPIDKAHRSLDYFRDTDTIEYVFEFVTQDDGLNRVHRELHVLAHDANSVHWAEHTSIR